MTQRWRIVTWNIRGAGSPDLTAITGIVQQYGPDVIALQEIRRNQACRLADLLGWQQVWARKHHPYSPLAFWLTEGLAIMSPHPLVDARHETISAGVSTWTYRHRIVLAATVLRGDDALRVHDTHLAAHRHPDERIAQARRVATSVTAEAAPLAVVAGDLNAPGELEVIREFHACGLRDPGGGPSHPSIAPRSRLDHVLVPDAARMVDQHEPEGGERWWALSDHVPVMVEFEG